jgi:hypothetical protein
MARPLKREFHKKRCTTQGAAMARFKQILSKRWTKGRSKNYIVGILKDYMNVED